MRVANAGPNESVTQFTGRMTHHDTVPLTQHYGCIFFGQGVERYPYPRNCCTVTKYNHPGMHFTTHLVNVNIETFDYCLGGAHEANNDAMSCEPFVHHSIIAKNVKVNGKPLEGTFVGIHSIGGDQIIYSKQLPFYPNDPVVPMFDADNMLHCAVFKQLLVPAMIDELVQRAKREKPAPVLVDTMALRITCRALFYDPRLQALSAELYFRTRTQDRRRPHPHVYSLWDPNHERVYLDTIDFKRFIVQGPQFITGATWRSGAISTLRFSLFQVVAEISNVLNMHGFDEDIVDHDVTSHFSVMIPVKPRSLHRPGYMYGSWLIGRRDQFGKRAWFQSRCFSFLKRIARVFEECGYGFDGRKFYLVDMVEKAFKAAPRDQVTGLRRLMYRLLWLQRALLTHTSAVEIQFEDADSY